MILRCIYLLILLTTSILASVEFTTPSAGDSIDTLTLDIAWDDDKVQPLISDLVTYQMFLCAGGNADTEYIQLATLVQQGDFKKGDSISVPLTAGLGADVENAYFIKVISAATGGVIINFSDRFSLTGMTGVFPATVVTGLKTVTGTKGPETVNQISSPQNVVPGAAAPPGGAAAYGTPYTLQSGSVRYAPMPPMAPTKITAKAKSMQFPTSAYTVYQTNAGLPNAITTQTAPVTFSVSSREATMVAAGQPTANAMQKFLNRWRD